MPEVLLALSEGVAVVTIDRPRVRNAISLATMDALEDALDAAADAETGRGLKLVASLSEDWGCYRTPAGKAVYFTLGFQPAG